MVTTPPEVVLMRASSTVLVKASSLVKRDFAIVCWLLSIGRRGVPCLGLLEGRWFGQWNSSWTYDDDIRSFDESLRCQPWLRHWFRSKKVKATFTLPELRLRLVENRQWFLRPGMASPRRDQCRVSPIRYGDRWSWRCEVKLRLAIPSKRETSRFQ